MNCLIRPYADTDLAGLARIYRDSIRQVGDEHYSKDQIAAWSGFADDVDDFSQWINRSAIFVAVSEEFSPVGFAGLEERGRVSSLFVAPEAMGRGIGSALLERLMSEVHSRRLARVTTDASEFSRPLFEKFGFRVRRKESTSFKGVVFERYVMDLQVRCQAARGVISPG